LPSRGDAYFFQSLIDVGFRVTDPAAVVRRNVTDGLHVVYNYLIDAFRPVTRAYDIGEAAAAESAINTLFQHPMMLEEGITIYHCRARLLPDDAAKDYLRSLESAKRTLHVGNAEHEVAVSTAHHTQDLAEFEQTGRIAAERRELDALREPVDLGGLIRTHLSKHPGDTAYATQLLMGYEQAKLERRGTDDQRWLELVKYMIDNDIIQAVDVEMLRKQTLDKIHQIAIPAPDALEAPAAWDKPLPMLSLAPEPSGQATGGAAIGTTAAAGVAPVYLIVDESVADEAYFRALDEGLERLPLALAEQPEVLAAVRLAILGYAHDVAARMPVNAVTADTALPPLTPRPGTSLASVAGYLQSQIPRDMDRLKSRHPKVFRPTAYLLCAAAPTPEPEWESGLARLLDRIAFPYAPNIVAFGAGDIPAGELEVFAAQPSCQVFAADPGVPLAEAAAHFTAFVQREIAAQVRAQISNRNDVMLAPPDGFHALPRTP
jgi:uncharacterized protein YegL